MSILGLYTSQEVEAIEAKHVRLLNEIRRQDRGRHEEELKDAREKLQGIVTERDDRIKRLEDEKTRILQDEGYISVASVQAEKLYKTISDLTAENAEQLEKIGEKERTITQQQQIIDDLRKPPEPPLQVPVTNVTNPQKPVPRTLPPDDWRNIPNTDSPAQEPTKPAPRKKAGAQ